MTQGKKEHKEVPLLNIESEDFSYRIYCENYYNKKFYFYTPPHDPINNVATYFSFGIKNYGSGAGLGGGVYTYEIKKMYRHLVMLKEKTIDKFSCTFGYEPGSKSFYFKVFMLRNYLTKQYEALFIIHDDLDTDRLKLFLSEENLDEQIRIFRECSNAFPIRRSSYRKNKNKNKIKIISKRNEPRRWALF